MKINYLDNKNLPQLAAFSILTAIFALSWDVWWHVAVGRDTFWEPPHLFLYTAVACGTALGMFGYLRFHKVWKYFVLSLGLIIISAPFDDMWHRAFGVERLNSIWIIWSPPHLMLIAGLLGSLWSIFRFLSSDDYTNKILKTLVLAAFLVVLFNLALPVHPLGPFHIFSFGGAGVFSALFIGTFLTASRAKGILGATVVALFFVVFYFLQEPNTIAPGVIIPPHPHPPAWIIVFSIVLPALAIDSLRDKFSPLMLGTLGAFIYAVIFYGCSYYFIEPIFQYSLYGAAIGIGSSLAGGLLVGAFLDRKYS